jgi:hypothetical protein
MAKEAGTCGFNVVCVVCFSHHPQTKIHHRRLITLSTNEGFHQKSRKKRKLAVEELGATSSSNQ